MNLLLILLIVVCPLFSQTYWQNIRLTYSAEYNGEPSMALNGTQVGIAYEGYNFGNDEILLLVSNDNGATFSPPIRVSNNDSASWKPKITATSTGFDIVWEDNRTGKREVYYARYSSGTMGPTLKISSGNVYSAFPAITANGNDIYCVWEDFRDGNDEIYLRKYVSGVWSPEKRLTTDDSTSWGADIARDPVTGTLHVVWFDYRTGNDEIYIISSNDDGTTWSSPRNLSNDAANSWEPRIAAYNNRIDVTWYSWRSDFVSYEVWYAGFNGETWTVPEIVSDPYADSKCPSISSDALGTIIAWEDYCQGNDEIYAAYKRHDSTTWGNKRITNNDADSYGADCAANATNLLFTWFDYRDTIDQIYFTKGLITDMTSIEQERVSHQKPAITIGPNPLNNLISVKIAGQHAAGTIELYDCRGALRHRYSCTAQSLAESVLWDTSRLPSGMYVVKILLGKTVWTRHVALVR